MDLAPAFERADCLVMHLESNVRVGWGGDDSIQETLERVDVIELSPEALTEACEKALELKERSCIYASTPPAKRRTDATNTSVSNP